MNEVKQEKLRLLRAAVADSDLNSRAQDIINTLINLEGDIDQLADHLDYSSDDENECDDIYDTFLENAYSPIAEFLAEYHTPVQE